MDRDEIDFTKVIAEVDVGDEALTPRAHVSKPVIRRLPRYFRYLRELIRQGKLRVSSEELARMMHVTASQIRQDLNCFGGFGHQGYGYNVKYLYANISEILGVNADLRAIIVGAGNLGRALVGSDMFGKRGVSMLAMFDVDENVIGRTIGDVPVLSLAELESFCRANRVDMAVLTVPKACAADVAQRLTRAGVRGLWNFTGKELETASSDVKIVNVHLGDSLMTLCYELNQGRDTETADAKETDTL